MLTWKIQYESFSHQQSRLSEQESSRLFQKHLTQNLLLFQKDLLILPLHCVLRDTLQDIVGILNIRIQF